MNEPFIQIAPHGGINTRFPEHKIVGESKGKPLQKLIELQNMLSLDGKFYIVSGASRFDVTAKTGTVSWMRRLYYKDGSDDKKYLFVVIGNKFYKANEATRTLNAVKISGSADTTLSPGFYPISVTLSDSGALVTYLVDGQDFYKFIPNEDGEWEKVSERLDLDGNAIHPIANAEWLDRHWVLVPGKNVLLGSASRQAEIFDDSTDSVLLQLPPGNGGYPRGLIKYRGTLYVFHDDYFVPVSGSSASTFGVRPGDLVEGYGTNAARSLILVKNKIGFLNSKDNEYYLTSGTFDSTDEIPLSYEIKLGDLINPVKAGDTVCHLDTELNALRIAYYLSGGTTLGSEEIYSLSENKWCGQTRDRNISCYAQWNGIGDDGRLTTGRSDTGLVMVDDETLNFDDSAIHFKWVSGSYIPADPFDVQFDEFFIDARPLKKSDIQVSYYIDARITRVGQEYVNTQGAVINVGLIEIADQNVFLNRFVPIMDKSKGRMIRFQIEGQTLNQKLEFFSLFCFFSKQETKFSKYGSE